MFALFYGILPLKTYFMKHDQQFENIISSSFDMS